MLDLILQGFTIDIPPNPLSRANNGKIPFSKLGRKALFERMEIERWVEDKKIKAIYDEKIPK